MIRKLSLMSIALGLSVFLAACGSTAIPAYEQEETTVAVARTSTIEALLTEGAIIPTNTPTITPSPTVDVEATNAVLQATADAETNAAATAQAEAEAAAEQATADAQATVDAMPTEIGADDPLFDAIQAADASNGEALFAANAGLPCTTCHSLEPDVRLAGPSQHGLFTRTVERLADGTIDAEGPYSYIYNSIVNPNDYITEGDPPYAEGVMPANYGELLSEQELYDLVAYLVTIGEE